MSEFDIRANLGIPGRPAADPTELCWRILDRALMPGGIDSWASPDHESIIDTGLVIVYLDRGRSDTARLLTWMTVERALNRMRRLGPPPIGPEAYEQLADAMETMSVDGMSVAVASATVQLGLFGEVRYR